MNSFLLALQFLTVIPISYGYIANDRQLGRSTLFYPAIGLLIGILLASLSLILNNSSVQIQAAIILILWVLLTGGLHLDGLADCADAWVGGLGSQQRSLEIMKDPASGPIAVIVLVLVLLLKWTLLMEILMTQSRWVLVVVPMLGRLAILILMLSSEYVRLSGLASTMTANLPRAASKVIIGFGIIIGILFLDVFSISLMLIMLLIIHHQAKQRIGGVTGDVYGAAVELVEVSLLMGVVL